jgi:hypothetical protein
MKNAAIGRTETVVLEWIARLVSIPAMIAAVVVPINQLTQSGAVVLGHLDRPLPPNPGPGILFTPVDASSLVQVDIWSGVPWWLRLSSEAGFAWTWFAIGFGALMVSRVLSAIAWGDPFDARNPRRIALIGGCVVVGGIVAPVAQDLAATAIVAHVDLTDRVSTPVDFSFVPLFVAGLVFVVASAFQRGRQLTADTEGLI